MKVQELMTPKPVCCVPGDSAQDAARMMGSYNVGSLPVVQGGDDNRLLGIVTDRDLVVGALAEGRFDATVADLMTAKPHTVRETDDASVVGTLMAEQQVRRVPVVDERGHVVGIVAQADLALSAGGISDREVGRVVERISEPGSETA